MQPGPSQLIRRTAICLTLGLATTWVVAAALALWSPERSRDGDWRRTEIVEPLSAGMSRGIKREGWTWVGNHSQSAHSLTTYAPGGKLREDGFNWDEQKPIGTQPWPRFGRVGKASADELLHDYVNEDASGFPVIAFWSYGRGDQQPQPLRGGFQLGPIVKGLGLRSSARLESKPIPLLPVWQGVFIDTVCYALLWTIPVFGLPAWKARRRAARGDCPQCGYDLRGNLDAGCNECGWRRA